MVVDSISASGAFWRHTGPLGRLRKSRRDVNLIYMHVDRVSWAELALSDIVFMQRPFSLQHLDIFENARATGTKIWLDYDDDLFNIPIDNATFDTYMDKDVKQRIAHMVRHADAVSVSTPDLYEKLKGLAKGLLQIVPNAIPAEFFPWRDRSGTNMAERSEEIRVYWRGSKHHQADLTDYGLEIVEVAKKHPDVKFIFHGFRPWWIVKCIENGVDISPSDVIKFHKTMRAFRPDILIVPLADNTFNKSKSNIAWIEGTMAGAATIAPRWPEWTMPGIKSYDSDKDFRNTLDEMICQAKEDRSKLHAASNESWKYILENLTLDKVNKKRALIIDALSGLK
jgi:hypothetical protein